MAFSLRTLVNVSELRYVDAVRTVVRTTVLIPLANVSELRYVDAVRTLVRTTIFIILNKKRILFMMLANVFSQTSDRFFPLETFLKFSLSKMPYNEIIK